jgi:hypothetical protein
MGEAQNEPQYPGFLLNHHDKQAHSLNDSPTFFAGGVRRFSSWAEFLEADPPIPEHYPDKLIAVCEDGNPWPVSFVEVADLQDRQMQYSEFENQAEQNAYAGSVRETYEGTMMRMWSIAALMVFCIVSAIIVLIAIQSQTAQSFFSINPSTMLPIALGLTLLKGRFRKQSSTALAVVKPIKEPKAKKEKKAKKIKLPKFKDWERVLVWDHYDGNMVWVAELPLRVLYEHIPPDCRSSYENNMARRWGAGVFGGVSLIALFALFFGLQVHIFWAILGPPFLSLIPAAFGYFKGYSRWMKAPIWCVRRVAIGTEPVMQGILHTRGTGIPPEVIAQTRRTNAETAFNVDYARRRQSQPSGDPGGHRNSAPPSLAGVQLAEYYQPSHYSSMALYEVMKGKDVKEHFKSGKGESRKLEQFSMAGMALGSIGLLIVALLLFGKT